MTKYELRDYKNLFREAEQLRGRLLRLRLNSMSPRNSMLTGSGGGGADSDWVGLCVARIDEVAELYSRKLGQLNEKLLGIEAVIERLPARERQLVRCRYIDGWDWERIARDMGYSVSHILRLHGQALLLLRDYKSEQTPTK